MKSSTNVLQNHVINATGFTAIVCAVHACGTTLKYAIVADKCHKMQLKFEKWLKNKRSPCGVGVFVHFAEILFAPDAQPSPRKLALLRQAESGVPVMALGGITPNRRWP